MSDRDPICSVSYSHCYKNDHIPGGPIWMLEWLPKGYGPGEDDRMIGVLFDTDGRWDTKKYGLGSRAPLPPLIAAIKAAIEAHLREHPEDIAGHASYKE